MVSAATGLQNPGYENGLTSWKVTQPATGNAVVVGAETSASYPVYGDMGLTTVSPFTGSKMLRIGIPKTASQTKGTTTVSQTFTSTGSDLGVAFRLFTLDNPEQDTFTIAVKNSKGKAVGRWQVTKPDGPGSSSSLPFTFTLPLDGGQTYGDSGWVNLRLSGLPTGTLTVSFTLDCSGTRPHHTWVYVDEGDLIPPNIAITSPADKSFTSNRAPTLAFLATDSQSGLAAAPEVKVDGSIVDKQSGQALGSLADGPHVLTVTASDNAGNEARAQSVFVVDTVAPDVTVMPSGGISPTPVLVLLVPSELATVYYTVDGSEPGPENSAGSRGYLALISKTATLKFMAIDLAGNRSGTRSEKYTISTDPPGVDITSPVEGSTVASATPRLTYDVTMRVGTKVANTSVQVDGGTPVPGDYDMSLGPLSDGTHIVKVTVTDTAGSKLSAQSTFKVDTTPPVITAPGDILKEATGPDGAVVTFAYTVTDAQDPSPTVSVSHASGSTFPIDSTVVAITAQDNAGNFATANFTVTVVPVAPSSEFTFIPADPHEGDVLGLYATPSANPEQDEQSKTWTWTIPGPLPEADSVYDGPVGYIVPDRAGDYLVTLRVTDDATQAWSETTQTIHVAAQPPRVQAMNAEVLEGATVKLVGRFLDPGWTDDHTATFVIGGESFAAEVVEDHAAGMTSGYVSASVTLPDGFTSGQGTLTVNDLNDEISASDTFQVSVVQVGAARDEPNDTFADLAVPGHPKLAGGSAHLSYVQSTGDIDIFEVTLPNGAPLPYGTEVLASLTDLPEDFDLAVLEDLGADAAAAAEIQLMPFLDSSVASSPYIHSPYIHSPYIHSPLEMAPYIHSPYIHSPLEDSPYIHSPYIHSPYADSPYIHSPYVDMPYIHSPYIHSPVEDTPYIHSPFLDTPYIHSPYIHSPYIHSPYIHSPLGTNNSLDGFPLSQMSYTGVASDGPSGTDIRFSELGFNNEEMAGKRIAGFSAKTGYQDEVVLTKIDAVGARLYVAVVGHYGAHSTLPYTLRLETSLPMDVLRLANEGVQHNPLVGTPNPVDIPTVFPASEVQTLFVTQAERMISLYGTEAWNLTLRPALEAACVDARIVGKVISVPAELYDAWDVSPWKTDLAQEVAAGIRDQIQDALRNDYPAVKYVVLVGSDKVIPQMRVLDQTIVGNERAYADTSFLQFDSPILASQYNSTVLTDDYYVDAKAIPFNQDLYIPDLVVSRLVETPAEIAGAIMAFVNGSGVLDGSTALVTSQDFMTDGAARVKETLLARSISTQVLEGNNWTGSQLRAGLLSGGTDIGSINAHFTHFAALSANGFTLAEANLPWSPDQLVTGTDIAGAADFREKLVFSMGCHAGLNVPDDQVVDLDPDAGIDPTLDLPQAMMQQAGVYVASTGYGYGDTVGVAGTEALIGMFADRLTHGAESVGQALKEAKQQYLGSLSEITMYDEKASIEFSMYGMPQYQLPVAVRGAGFDPATLTAQAVPLEAQAQTLGTFTLKVIDGDPLNPIVYPSATLIRYDTAGGSYITADGDYQATADRPIQPRLVIPIDNTGKDPVRSIILHGGPYTDYSSFDPVISRWTVEWEANPVEYQVSTSGWWPADPSALNSIETGGGYEQRLVVNPAQFLPAEDIVGDITGTERVWTELTVELVRAHAPSPSNPDVTPPTLTNLTATVVNDTAHVFFSAIDSGGVVRAVISEEGPNQSVPHDFDLSAVTPAPGGGYSLEFPIQTGVDAELLWYEIRVSDGAGNTTAGTTRGLRVPARVPDSEAFIWSPGANGSPGTRIDLGTLGGLNAEAMAINNSGQVVGWAQHGVPTDWLDGMCHAFLWEGGNMIDLGTLGGPNSCAIDINDSGQIVGVSDTPDLHKHLFLWESGTMQDLGEVGFPDAVYWAYPRVNRMCQINNQGEIYSWLRFADPIYLRPFIVGVRDPETGSWTELTSDYFDDYTYWGELGLSPLAFGDALGDLRLHGGGDFNDAGQVCLDNLGARIWRPDGSTTELGSLGGTGARAFAMGPGESVVGMSQLPDSTWHACLWQPGATPMTPIDLGIGLGASCALYASRDDQGQDKVTGLYAGADGLPKTFFWDGSRTDDIGNLGGDATCPFGLNSSGQIAGASYYDDPSNPYRYHAFSWVPGGSFIDLTPLSGRSAATDLNEAGQVVGYLYPRADQ